MLNSHTAKCELFCANLLKLFNYASYFKNNYICNMNIVKVLSTRISETKRLIKFLRYGKSDVQENYEVAPFGVDANPTKDMIAIYSKTDEIGNSVILGYINKNQLAEIGENRIYSTDADGVLSFYLHLKNDGTANFGGDTDFMVRYSELESAFNELKDDFNTLVNTFNTHVHPGVTSGGASTSPTPTSGTTSSADISGAKIEEIKTL